MKSQPSEWCRNERSKHHRIAELPVPRPLLSPLILLPSTSKPKPPFQAAKRSSFAWFCLVCLVLPRLLSIPRLGFPRVFWERKNEEKDKIGEKDKIVPGESLSGMKRRNVLLSQSLWQDLFQLPSHSSLEVKTWHPSMTRHASDQNQSHFCKTRVLSDLYLYGVQWCSDCLSWSCN